MQGLSIHSLIRADNIHRPLKFHGILWTLAFLILVFIFSRGTRPTSIDIIYTLGFIAIVAIPVCINFYILIPKFLKREKHLLYSLGFILNAGVFSALMYWSFQTILDTIFPSYFFISYFTGTYLVLVIAIFLVSTTLLKLGEDWFYFNSNQNKILKLKSLQFETQLTALRSQINPHFLFNSLNVIYALALDKRENITKAILELSDILRYVIYDSNTKHVALKDEIQLLKNYIAFQNHRVETPHPTAFQYHVEDDNFPLYPMLLLPLLENSYKHGVIPGEPAAPVSIKLDQKGSRFQFEISNPILNPANTINDKHSGVGLENLKNNLNLVYPNRHTFKVDKNNAYFTVSLTLINEA